MTVFSSLDRVSDVETKIRPETSRGISDASKSLDGDMSKCSDSILKNATASLKKRTRRRVSAFCWMILATFFIRGAVLFSSLDSFDADPDDYRRLAENWYLFNVFGTETTATAFRPPLYPWALKTLVPLRRADERPAKTSSLSVSDSPCKVGFSRFFDEKIALSRNASIAFFHWILGIATVALVYFVAQRFGLGTKIACGAGLLVAIDPILLQQSRLVMTETFAAFFAALLVGATLVCLDRRSTKVSFFYFFALGLLFGLSILCRPAFFAFAGLIFLFFAMRFIAETFAVSASRRLKLAFSFFLSLATFLIGLGVALIPWGARNFREFGRPILTTTHDGYTLFLANNAELYAHYRTTPAWTLWNPESFHRRRVLDFEAALDAAKIKQNSKESEIFQNEWTREQAIALIRENPSMFLYASGLRIGELWRVLPNDVDAFSNVSGTEPSSNAVFFESKSKKIEDSKKTKNSLHSRKSAKLSSSTLSAKDWARFAVAVFYSLELSVASVGVVALFGVFFRSKNRRKTMFLADSTFFEPSRCFDRAAPWIVGFLLVASVQIPHLIYWTNMRMRAPLEIFLPILAFYGLAVFCPFVRRDFFKNPIKSV